VNPNTWWIGSIAPSGTTTIRDVLALSLIALSAAGITLAALSAIGHGGRDEADKVFTTVVGLGGAWVSTILVYYFSKENFQAAQTATQETLRAALGSSQPKLLVADKMIKRKDMLPLDLTNTTEAAIKLSDLRAKLNDRVTRIPVVKGNIILYVIHDASIYRMFLDLVLKKQQPADTITLADLLDTQFDNGDKFGNVVRTFACVPITATVDDAQAALQKVHGAQDVFVTQSGQTSDPVLGWLTDTLLAKSGQS